MNYSAEKTGDAGKRVSERGDDPMKLYRPTMTLGDEEDHLAIYNGRVSNEIQPYS